MEYAFPYLLLICAFGGLAIWHDGTDDNSTRIKIECACVALFVFFFGFRGFAFYDWNVYYPYFKTISLNSVLHLRIDAMGIGFEPGFVLLNCACKYIVNDYHFFVLVCTLINTGLLLRFFKKYISNLPLAFMICICMNGLYLCTDLMRNSIAILIMANAIEFIYKRKPFHYFGLCLLALTFHITALLFVPLYFFLHKKINKWWYAGIFAVANVIYLMHIPVFLTLVDLIVGLISPQLQYKITAYTELMANDEFRLSIGYLERLLTASLVFCFYETLQKKREDSALFLNSLILFFISFFFFSEFKTVSQRLSYLFSFGYWVIWIDLISCFTIKSNQRLYLAFIGIYCLFKTYGSTNNIIAKYDNVLLGAQTYSQREYIYNRNYSE